MRAAFAATAGLAAVGIALASARDSSMYTAACPDGTMAGHGPWPGAAYALPALAALVAGWALTEWTIRLIAARAPEPVSDAGDGGRRALAARTAVTAAGLMVAPTLAGCSCRWARCSTRPVRRGFATHSHWPCSPPGPDSP